MKNLIVIATVLLTGCLGSRNAQNIRTDIETQKYQLTKMMGPIDSLDKKREEKLRRGELDEKTDSIVANYIRQLKDSISSRLARFNVLSDNQTLRSNKKAAVAYLNAARESYKKEIDNIVFLDDLFNASTFSRLNTAAFFAPGQYMLTDITFQEARTIMGQLIGDALQFSSKYSEKKLRAMFVITGYADEENIAPGSELYQSLSSSLSIASPGRKQLNKELSSRRAVAIKDILAKEYYLLSKDKNTSNLSSNFLALGKGEELPDRVNEYKPIDERRRVVLLYWSMLPEL